MAMTGFVRYLPPHDRFCAPAPLPLTCPTQFVLVVALFVTAVVWMFVFNCFRATTPLLQTAAPALTGCLTLPALPTRMPVCVLDNFATRLEGVLQGLPFGLRLTPYLVPALPYYPTYSRTDCRFVHPDGFTVVEPHLIACCQFGSGQPIAHLPNRHGLAFCAITFFFGISGMRFVSLTYAV